MKARARRPRTRPAAPRRARLLQPQPPADNQRIDRSEEARREQGRRERRVPGLVQDRHASPHVVRHRTAGSMVGPGCQRASATPLRRSSSQARRACDASRGRPCAQSLSCAACRCSRPHRPCGRRAASSLVNSWALPCAWAARPPSRAISRCFSGSNTANPRFAMTRIEAGLSPSMIGLVRRQGRLVGNDGWTGEVHCLERADPTCLGASGGGRRRAAERQSAGLEAPRSPWRQWTRTAPARARAASRRRAAGRSRVRPPPRPMARRSERPRAQRRRSRWSGIRGARDVGRLRRHDRGDRRCRDWARQHGHRRRRRRLRRHWIRDGRCARTEHHDPDDHADDGHEQETADRGQNNPRNPLLGAVGTAGPAGG